MVVVLGQCHDVALRRDAESTAAAHFNVRALKLTNKRAVTLKHCNMESVAMRIPNEDIASV